MHEMVWIQGLDNFWFVPLITRRNGLGCRLDIKFMRPGKPGDVLHGGDLDNRLKTLLDGLRMPHSAAELKGPQQRKGPMDFFYCLLEDDSLITDIAIATERLLTPQSYDESEARLSIGVSVYVVEPSELNRDYRD